MIEFQLLAGLRGVEKSIPNDNNLFPLTVSQWVESGEVVRGGAGRGGETNNLMDWWDVLHTYMVVLTKHGTFSKTWPHMTQHNKLQRLSLSLAKWNSGLVVGVDGINKECLSAWECRFVKCRSRSHRWISIYVGVCLASATIINNIENVRVEEEGRRYRARCWLAW